MSTTKPGTPHEWPLLLAVSAIAPIIQIAAACRVSMAPQLESIQADIHDERSVADAVAGAYGLVNAVSLYAERG